MIGAGRRSVPRHRSRQLVRADTSAPGAPDVPCFLPKPGSSMAKKIRRLRWWMISLLMLGAIINYLTRSTLSVAGPTLRDALNITPEQFSYIVSTFQVAIMLQPIAGYVLDVVGLKIGFAIFAVAWSVISMSHGLATSWLGLAGLRGLLGLAEGCANPAGVKAISTWFPAKE